MRPLFLVPRAAPFLLWAGRRSPRSAMPDVPNRLFIVKRLLIAAATLVAFVMASVIGSRIAVESLFKGIASSRATGLSAVASWDTGSMLAKGRGSFDSLIPLPAGGSWIARSAELHTRSSHFDQFPCRGGRRDLLLVLALYWCPIRVRLAAAFLGCPALCSRPSRVGPLSAHCHGSSCGRMSESSQHPQI